MLKFRRPSQPEPLLSQEIVPFFTFALLGALASYLSVNIPHTEVFVEMRWVFGYLGFALLHRFWLALLLAVLLCLTGFHQLPLGVVFFGNLSFALPFGLSLRLLNQLVLNKLPTPTLHGLGWFLAVLAGYQLFTTPVVWTVLGLTHGRPVLDMIVEGWREQPFFVESIAVALLSALILVIHRTTVTLGRGAEHLSTLLHSIGDAVMATDQEGQVTMMNPVAERLTGWSGEEALGRPLEEVFVIKNARTRETVETPVRKVMEQGEIVGLANHTLLVSLDGREYQIADSASPIRDSYGLLLGVVLVFRDVTEEYRLREEARANEERWKFALDGARSGVWDWDATTNLVFYSREWKRMLGYEDHEIGNHYSEWEDRLHPDDLSRVLDELKRHLRGEVAYYVSEHRMRCKDGSWKWILDRGKVVERDAAGGALRAIGVHTDITAQKEYQEELRISRDAAEKANQAKVEFLANMSHELRTPINGLMGMLQLLERTGLGKNQTQFVSHAMESCRRLTRLVGDILDLSSVESGTMGIAHSEFDLRECLNGVHFLFAPSARQKGLPLGLHVDPRLPALLVGDPQRLTQVLNNLIGNALKFTERGEVWLEAYPLPSHPGDGHVQRVLFVVSDTGVGMSEHELQRLFEPFAQGEASYTRKYQGAGLGLTITRRLLELMDGGMDIASAKGVGVSVHLCVPFELPAGGDAGKFAREPVRMARPTPRRILLVEDEDVARLAAAHLLADDGHEVEQAVNGRQALDMLRAKPFDLVLMDVQLPEMDGLEATRRLRSDPGFGAASQTLVLALTAFAQDEDRERCLESGMDGYVSKPIEMRELQEAMDRLFQQRDSRSRP